MGTDLGFGRLPEGTGASADADQALVSDQAASRLAPPGFDPSRALELAELCEQAAGPDELLNWEIFGALGNKPYRMGAMTVWRDAIGIERLATSDSVPRYTSSLDAAMTLVPEGANFVIVREGGAISASVPLAGTRRSSVAFAATPALALCAAALRARGDKS